MEESGKTANPRRFRVLSASLPPEDEKRLRDKEQKKKEGERPIEKQRCDSTEYQRAIAREGGCRAKGGTRWYLKWQYECLDGTRFSRFYE